MGAVTGGEIRGTVLTPGQRGPTLIGKLGFDRQVNKDLRVRLTGSMYKTDKSMSNTLYGGDRAGSRYYYVLENTAATETAQKDSGLINPGFKNKVTAFQMNPFVKFRGLELFGVIERAKGKASTEATERDLEPVRGRHGLPLPAGREAVRRRPLQQGAGRRWPASPATSAPIAGRSAAAGSSRRTCWRRPSTSTRSTSAIPPTNIKNGGKFNGLMLEGVVAF